MNRSIQVLIVLGVVVALLAADFLARSDPRADELNRLLSADPQLAAYPYDFRVLELDDGIAVMSSPRSADVSVTQFLGAAFPRLRNLSATDPAIMEAQQELAEVQARAAELVGQQADVRGVRWELDRRWLESHGVYLP